MGTFSVRPPRPFFKNLTILYLTLVAVIAVGFSIRKSYECSLLQSELDTSKKVQTEFLSQGQLHHSPGNIGRLLTDLLLFAILQPPVSALYRRIKSRISPFYRSIKASLTVALIDDFDCITPRLH